MDTIKLFTDIDKSLKEFLTSLNPDKINSLAPPEAIKKGMEYTINIKSISFANNNTLDATVQGSLLYAVSIFKSAKYIKASCNCPYESEFPCKHTIAVLLRIAESSELFAHHVQIQETEVAEYLKTLKKDELIDLIMKWATVEFKEYLINCAQK